MARYEYDFVVLGGGAAGLTAASGASQLGAKTLLVNADPELGGDCLHYGCVPSKALVQAGQVAHTLSTADRFGLKSYQPEVDWPSAQRHIRSSQAVAGEHDAVSRFEGLGVEVVIARGAFTGPHTLHLQGVDGSDRVVFSRQFLIATGSVPNIPPIEGLSEVLYLTNETIFDLEFLPESLIVLGAGPIGCELGQAFARLGVNVTLLNRAPDVLGTESPMAQEVIRSTFEKEGVELVLGMNPLRVEERSGGIVVTVESLDGSTQELSAQHLLVATGRKPVVEGLGLDAAGVKYTKRGVVVNSRLRTSQSHIWSAGDCNGLSMFTHSAGYQGGVVVSNAIVGFPQKVNLSGVPRVTYTHPEVASTGKSESELQSEGIHYTRLFQSYEKQDRALTEGETSGGIEVFLDRRGRLLGATLVGEHAGEILPILSLLQGKKLKMSTLLSQIFPYPTRSEILKGVIGSHVGKSFFTDRTRSILRHLWGYRGTGPQR